MVKMSIDKAKTTILAGAMTIAFFTILSKLLALVRNQLLAFEYGASQVTDAYYAAFRLPDLISNTVFVGALSVAFIPVLIEYMSAGKEQKIYEQDNEHWVLANSLLNLLLLVTTGLIVVLFVLAPWLVPLFTPGFDHATLALTVMLTRVMLGGVFFLALSSILGGILQAHHRFTMFSLAPVKIAMT